MTSRNTLIVVAILAIIISILTTIDISVSPINEERALFPGIIGDVILKSNETGINFIRNITLYDNFRGNIIQGYKAIYSSNNGTMTIFMVQMKDNVSANRSLKDMAVRAGFNESTYNESEIPRLNENVVVVKLPVQNPEVFAMQKSWNQTLHYVFSKKDKVYWIGFNNDQDIPYQLGMIVEVYKNVDKKKGDFAFDT